MDAGLLARLHERGLKVCVWINPYIAQRSALFDEGMAGGYLLKRTDGTVWQWDMWQAGMGIVDFTNPAARAWFAAKLDALMEMGVDAFKTDFGERIPVEEVAWFDGSDPRKMHNYYAQIYNQTVFEAIKARRGEGDAVVFARAATAGGQQFPVHWGGDCTATFESMAESLRGGLSLHLSGFGFWSHDIGGFEQASLSAGERAGVRGADVYKRWCAFGLLSSHSRLHGSTSYRVPWAYDEEAVQVLAKFTRLKASLMPYLYQAAVQAHQVGMPMLRAMMLAFPGDPACETLDRQYMLGDSLLVAPVLREDSIVEYYLPAGTWTNFLTDEVVTGGSWRREKVDYLSIPLWVPENSVIPVGARDDRPDYDYAEGLTLHIFNLSDGAKVDATVPDTLGDSRAVFHVERQGQALKVTRLGAPGTWSVLVRGKDSRSVKVEGSQALVMLS